MDSPIFHLASALGWGLVSVAGLAVGAFIGLYGSLTHRSVAATMAVAAGLLLAAATVELAANAIGIVPSAAAGLLALLVGALAFSSANAALAARGAADRKRCGECVAQPQEALAPGSGLAIALGTAMDAIPEALVLGLTLKSVGPQMVLITAISLGNLPEALSGSAGMLAAGRKPGWILSVWGGVAIATVAVTGVGFVLADSISPGTSAVLELFGAGALIAMVTETIIPEAVHGTPRFAGTVAAVGFGALLLVGQLAH